MNYRDIYREKSNTHSLPMGYVLWIFGFTGAHRFYFGRPISATIYFFTFGLLGIGLIVDLFLMPSLDAEADWRYRPGEINYSLAWIFLTFLGVFGVHRFYMKKYFSGILYLLTGGFFALGILYDYWTLNDQVSEVNERSSFI